uniref:Helicase ATP-binding domain-containing protein n=1 Tax=viral metagenome TaxID=1070528 RepID=A0A6C0J8V2_9ZZZZ
MKIDVICDSLKKNNNINPITNRKINPEAKNGIFAKYKKICSENTSIDLSAFPKKNLKLEPLILQPHQQKVVDFMKKKENTSLLVVHSTGSGKTLTALATTNELLKQKTTNVIIITTKNTLPNWKNEYEKYWGYLPNNFYFLTYQAISNNPKLLEKCTESILIIDEIHLLKKYVSLRGNRKINSNGIGSYIKYKYGITKKTYLKTHSEKELLDEVPDEYKYTYKSSRVLHNIKCALKSWKVLLLTATPIINQFYDIKNIYIILNKLNLNTTAKSINLDNLMVSYYTVDYNKNKYFPEVKHINKFIKLNDGERKRYNNLLKGFDEEDYDPIQDKDWLFSTVTGVMILYNYMRRAGDAGFRGYYSPKIDFIYEKIKQSKKKTLIHTTWIKTGVKVLIEVLQKITPNIYVISGQTKNTQDIIDEFNENDDFKIIIITSAGKEGLNLKGVRYIYLLEPNWNEASTHQAISRAVRFKSHIHLPENERNVVVYKIYINDSVDTILLDKYINKKKTIIDDFCVKLKEISI